MRPHVIARATCALVVLSSSLFAQVANEDSKLVDVDAQTASLYGFSVAMDDNRAIVGAVLHNDFAADGGVAYIYERMLDGSWFESAKLVPATNEAADLFGAAVSIDGDRVAVAQWFDDDAANNCGAVFIFERQLDNTWLEVHKIVPSDGQAGDQFGTALKLDGDRLAVTSLFDADNGTDSGSAYVYDRQMNGTWLEVAKLKPLDGAALDQFGASIDLEGDSVVVGSPFDDDGAMGAGSAYYFLRLANGQWRQRFKFVAPDPFTNDVFGSAVSLEGDRVFIGARGQDNGQVFQSGEVYEYQQLASNNWILVERFQPVTPTVSAEFGNAIEVRGNRAVVGAWVEADQRGAAYVFDRQTDGSWLQAAHLIPSDGVATDRFGVAVGFDGTYSISGAYQADTAFVDSGAAYIYNSQNLFRGTPTLSVSTGGTQDLWLRAGTGLAGQVFVMLGSASGISPGFFEGASGITIPLNLDSYFLNFLSSSGSGIVSPFFGFLDGGGNANAALTIPVLSPSLAGITLYHAYITIDFFGTGLMSSASTAATMLTVP